MASPENKTIDPVISTEPTEKKPVVLKSIKEYEAELAKEKAKFAELQKSFERKSQEYNKLLEAYKALAVRYTNDGAAARAFIETAHIGIDLLFPKENH